MRNKLRKLIIRGRNKEKLSFSLIMFIAAILVLFVISLTHAQTSQEETAQIEQQLADIGYYWLINYTLNENEIPSIKVYEKDMNETIAVFDKVDNESFYKVFLSNLSNSSEYSQNIFDLRVVGSDIEFDYIVDPLFLVGDTSYASNDTNVTQETGF
ncbi:MAG: hypothetical protein AABW75_03060, partial [Nanoarchaeota archaeon]